MAASMNNNSCVFFALHQKKGSQWKEIPGAVTFCIFKDLVPIYTVEKLVHSDAKTVDLRYENTTYLTENTSHTPEAETADRLLFLAKNGMDLHFILHFISWQITNALYELFLKLYQGFIPQEAVYVG